MTEFNKLYGQLNKAQKEAVDTIEGPVMVVAGPGTGKTQILTLRIANILLKTDTPPGGILALTFTEAGAKEMKRRLREIIGPQANDVRIHTYHGFANSIIVEFDDHFPHLGRIKQITEIEAEMLVRDILKENDLRNCGRLVSRIFTWIKLLARLVTPKKKLGRQKWCGCLPLMKSNE